MDDLVAQSVPSVITFLLVKEQPFMPLLPFTTPLGAFVVKLPSISSSFFGFRQFPENCYSAIDCLLTLKTAG